MNRKPHGRIEDHTAGSAGPTPEDIAIRAREIALIEGREGGRSNANDLKQAEEELHNEHLRMSDNEEPAPKDVEPGTHVAVDTGHKTEDRKPADPQLQEEAEVREGMREAEHDTMLQNRISEQEKEK